jgi:hypothetical protein
MAPIMPRVNHFKTQKSSCAIELPEGLLEGLPSSCLKTRLK